MIGRNQMIRGLSRLSVALFVAGAAGLALAQNTSRIILQKVDVAAAGDQVTVRMSFSEPLKSVPAGFSVADPSRIVMDIPGAESALSAADLSMPRGYVKNLRIGQTEARMRLVINLDRSATYQARLDGSDLVVSLAAGATVGDAKLTESAFSQSQRLEKLPSVKDVSFRRGVLGEGRVVIDMDDPSMNVDVKKSANSLLIDFSNATASDSILRKLDVLDFSTPVSDITTSRIGKDRVRVEVKAKPGMLWEHLAYQTDTQFVLEVKQILESSSQLGGGIGRYKGERMSLRFRDYPVREVIQAFSDFANFNIVISDSVAGNITLNLQDVPWDQALDVILQQRGLEQDRTGDVVTIATRTEILERRKAREELVKFDPLRDEIFVLSYMKTADAKKRIDEYMKNDATGETQSKVQGQSAGLDPGAYNREYRAGRVTTYRITADEETNKLFIRASEETLSAIKRLLKEIDVPKRQVLIEARIIEANDGFSSSLGAKLGFGAASTKGTDLYDVGQIAGGSNLSLPITTTGVGNLKLYLANALSTRTLSLELNAAETDGKTKLVASPKVLTENSKSANITDGKEIPFQTTSQNGTTTEFKKAALSLTVKPTIYADGRVALEILVTKDSPGAPLSDGKVPIDTKSVTTSVVVENGGTVVVGGVFNERNVLTEERVPFLGSIPFVGWLFKTKSKEQSRSEMLIFITPRIVSEDLRL